MVRIIKNSLGSFFVILVIFSLVTGWFYSGWPQIWQNPSISQIFQRVSLSTLLLLTGVLVFAILKIVNPPRAYFL